MSQQERLSVETAREHVADGHGGKFEPYCYRCQFFAEQQGWASERLGAIEKRRLWVYPRGTWEGRIGFGADEHQRHTFYVGRLVVALWRCRCNNCKQELADLRRIAEDDRGQRDRDAQAA